MNRNSLNIGVIGCGTISATYFRATRIFPVLDTVQALPEPSETGCHTTLESRCEGPAPLPLGVAGGHLGGGDA